MLCHKRTPPPTHPRQGANSALESCLVLDGVLAAAAGDLSKVPAAFTSARLADAHALQEVDRLAYSFFRCVVVWGAGRWKRCGCWWERLTWGAAAKSTAPGPNACPPPTHTHAQRRKGIFDPDFLALLSHVVLGTILSKIVPFIYGARPALLQLGAGAGARAPV